MNAFLNLLGGCCYSLASVAVLAASTQASPSLYSSLQGETGLDLVINLLVALLGGVTHSAFLLKSSTSVRRWQVQLLVDGLVSAFAGLLVFALTERTGTDPFTQLAIVGLTGWVGGSAIDSISRRYFGEGLANTAKLPPILGRNETEKEIEPK